MNNDLKIAIWKIANLAIDLEKEEISVAEFEQSSEKALSKVKCLDGNAVKLREESLSDEDKKSKLVEHTKKLLNSSK